MGADWKRRSKILIAAVTGLAALAGIGYRVYSAYSARMELARMYPKLEQLVAIYSLVSWRKPEQQAPLIKENHESGGSEFRLACNTLKWGSGGASTAGELFECFAETTPRLIPVEGKTVDAMRLNDSGDYWYSFQWETLFGYQANVRISGDTSTPQTRSRLQRDLDGQKERCMEELGRFRNAHELCSFTTYYVRMEGLTQSKSVDFVVAAGYPSWLSDGSVDRRNEWVVYLEDKEPITVGELNKFIQLAARQMQIRDTDLARVVPELEARWMDKDRAFVAAFFAELDRVPDLTKISEFLSSP